ncbi:uncharacterized protein RAG0_12308 [Rhynchosporium agropyri]|uniref:Uncharacterized protein n=1 Tax=Rhynchosporium agropyri TaxID=914238 RepID=A0A1E1L7Y4_9HELO|nr:uncharacterized protein RAG0_12308 [Rhynchosporium agropyri]
MRISSTFILTITFLSSTTLSAPTSDALAMFAVPDSEGISPCRCVRICYATIPGMADYCNNCDKIKDQYAQIQCFTNVCCECVENWRCGLH